MEDNTTLLLTLAAAATSAALLYTSKKKTNSAPLPPGPKGLPLIGNVADLPQSQPWLTFSKWGDEYGKIVHVNALGKPIIILNDATLTTELLDKKGKLYSDRPTLMMAGELVGWVEGPALASFDGGRWSEHRRYLAQFMGSRTKVESFKSVLEDAAHGFLKRVLERPEDWIQHTKLFAGSSVLLLTYGYKLEREDDEFLRIVTTAMDEFSELTGNGAYMVDVFPFLRYVPSWSPGAAWKRKIPHFKANMRRMIDVPFNWAKQQVETGAARPGFVTTLLSKDDLSPEQEYDIKQTAAGIYGGGADTTVAGIRCFFLAMLLWPAAQAKAQAEIDRVVGSDRLPSLDDRPHLPYVEALFLEVLRRYPFTPLALPHVAREDDVHDGYFIPKGTTVIPNVWRFLKDPDTYPNPDLFSPERFLASEGHVPEKDPRDYIFGYGRRICPGRHLGEASMWLIFTSVLATFDITAPVKGGKPVLPTPKFSEGSISHPEPFDCVVKPRSAAAVTLIHS